MIAISVRKKVVTALGVAIFLTACSQRDNIEDKSSGSDNSAAATPTQISLPKQWEPYSYSPSDSLVNIENNNVSDFTYHLLAVGDKLKKDTYETSQQHKERLRTADVSPFSREKIYLAEYEGGTRYNADKQRFEPVYSVSCYDTLGCSIFKSFDEVKGYYNSENNFGVKAKVKQVDKYKPSLSITRQNMKALGMKIGYYGDASLPGNCPVAIETAKKYRESDVKIGYLYKITSFEIVKSIDKGNVPTVSDPIEGFEFKIDIPAKIIGYICYSNDGEILYRSEVKN